MKISVKSVAIVISAILTVALVAGAGGAVAGAKYLYDGKDIKKHSIPANRLKGVAAKQIDGKIQGKKIANRSISRLQIASDSITTNELSDGTVEELQPTVEYVDNVVSSEGVPDDGYVAVRCPTGTQVTGGYVKPGGTGLVSFANSYIDPAQNALMVQFSIRGTVNVQTICLR